jgi:hypothetical protein
VEKFQTETPPKRATSKRAAEAAHSDLARWRSPADFVGRVDQIQRNVQSGNLFHSRDFNFLTEALALSEFVELYAVEEVRLNAPSEQHPDAFIRLNGEVVDVEITEVLNQGRRRGNEYRDREVMVRHSTPEELETRRTELEPAITAAICRKVDRGNHNGLLLVYVELQIHGDLTADEKALIMNAKKCFLPKFRDICVVCKGKLY